MKKKNKKEKKKESNKKNRKKKKNPGLKLWRRTPLPLSHQGAYKGRDSTSHQHSPMYTHTHCLLGV